MLISQHADNSSTFQPLSITSKRSANNATCSPLTIVFIVTITNLCLDEMSTIAIHRLCSTVFYFLQYN